MPFIFIYKCKTSFNFNCKEQNKIKLLLIITIFKANLFVKDLLFLLIFVSITMHSRLYMRFFMINYKQEFLEIETISKAYVDNFFNNYFAITDSSKIPTNIKSDMVNMYIMYEYLNYKQKCGLRLKEEEFSKFLNAIGRTSYAKTLVEYCKLCGKFTRDYYDDVALARYMTDFAKKKFNLVLTNYDKSRFEQFYVTGNGNV